MVGTDPSLWFAEQSRMWASEARPPLAHGAVCCSLPTSYSVLAGLVLVIGWGGWKCEGGQVRVGLEESLVTDSGLRIPLSL